MSENTTKCPACGYPVTTPAEAASHVCPSGPTDAEIDLAQQASEAALRERRKITPTKDRLLKDCITAAQQLNDFWDGEVECIVVMVPRDTMNLAYCTSIGSSEKLYAVFGKLLNDTTKITNIKNKAKS